MPTSSPPQRAAAADLGLRALGLATLVAILGSAVVPMSLDPALDPLPASIGSALLIANQLLCGLGLLLPRRRAAASWALLAMLVLATALMAPYRYQLDPPDIWSPGYWAVPLLVQAITSMRPRRYLEFGAVTAAGLLLANAVGMVLAHWTPDRTSLADNIFVVLPIADLLLFGDAMMRVADARARTALRRDDAQRRQRDQEVASHHRREVARILHDHVLHALNAIAQPRQVTPAPLAVDEARTALQEVLRPAAEPAVVPVENLLRDDPALQLSGARLVGESAPVPKVVAQAIVQASHEALTNVSRHARASTCRVEVAQHQHGVQVRVMDDGRGFDAARRPAGNRLGLAHSVVQRMADIGGVAEIDSAPGRGTTVTLTWPQEAGGASTAWTTEAPSELARRALTRTAWPGLALGILLTLLVGPLVRPAWPGMLSAMLALGVGCWGALRLRRRPLSVAAGAVLLVTAVLAWLVNLALVPSPWSIYLLWMAWGSSAVVHLVVLASRVRTGVIVVVSWTAVELGTVVARYGVEEFTTRLSSTVLAGAGETAATLLAIALARRLVDQEQADAQVVDLMRSTTLRLQEASRLDAHWSARVTGEVLPLLRAVGEGGLDVADDLVRDRARAMEASLRDELVLGPGHAGLLTELSRARAAGWQLASTLTPEDDVVALRLAEVLVAALGSPTHRGQGVTLSTRGSQVLAVVLAATPQQRRRWERALGACSGTVEVDPDFTRLVLPDPC